MVKRDIKRHLYLLERVLLCILYKVYSAIGNALFFDELRTVSILTEM